MSFNLKPLSLEFLVSEMENNKPFTMSRYKDGEFYAVLQNKGTHNCDKHTYFKDMGQAILQSLINHKDYLYCMQPLVCRNMHKQVDELFQKHNINLNWFDGDMIHRALRDGELYPLIKQLKQMDVVIIGPERLKAVKGKILNNVQFVTIPQTNCWLEKDRIENDILKTKGDIYLFSSSMPTPVMIDDLYPHIGKDSFMIDFGSIWEGLLSIPIRSYQKAMLKQTRERNLNITK